MVVLEIRHPERGPLTRGDLAALGQALVRHVPLPKSETATNVAIQVGPEGPTPMGPARSRVVHRFLSRDRRTSVSFDASALSIETTAYVGWDRFREIVDAAVAAGQMVAPVVGVERVGLRYIDEIRIPAMSGQPDWEPWVASGLLAPRVDDAGVELHAIQQQAVVQYGTSRPADTLTLRYGALNGPPIVTSSGSVLRPNQPEPGSFFLLDTDAAWTLPEDDAMPEVDATLVLEIADRLHGPVKALFEALITDRLRKEVLNAE